MNEICLENIKNNPEQPEGDNDEETDGDENNDIINILNNGE